MIQAIRTIKTQIDEAKIQLDHAERRSDLEAAARLRYGTLPDLDTTAYPAPKPSCVKCKPTG